MGATKQPGSDRTYSVRTYTTLVVQTALQREQGRRQTLGLGRVPLMDIVAEWLEERAAAELNNPIYRATT